MPFAIGGNQLDDTGYQIQNSGRFDNAGGSALGTTFGTATNSKKFTLSFWYKMSSGTTSGGRTVFGGRSGYNNIFIHEDTIRMDWNNASSGTVNWAPELRDQSAWYHFVIAQDTSQSTDTERIKFYVNGTQAGIRSGVTLSYPAQNLEDGYNVSGVDFFLSSYNGTAGEVNAYYADVYFVDGQQYAPTVFAETNDNGVWIPKEAKGDVAFGNNGFFLEFQQTGTGTNASGIGADTSGNDNHLSVAGLAAQDITTDTPTNNFCTFNPLIAVQQVPTYSEGNTKVTFKDGGNGCSPLSTFAVNSGKWYFEAKFVETSVVGKGAIGVGIVDADKYNPYGDADDAFDLESFGYSYTTDGHAKTNNSTSSFGATYGNGDIIGVAVDFDNRQIYYSKNGTLQNSGDPTSGSSGTGSAHNFSAGTYHFAVYGYQDENNWEMNFGNAPFSISSGNSDANGHGNFEYAVPSGYFALCTKNLAEHG